MRGFEAIFVPKQLTVHPSCLGSLTMCCMKVCLSVYLIGDTHARRSGGREMKSIFINEKSVFCETCFHSGKLEKER